MRDIGFVASLTVVSCTVAICICVGVVFGKTAAERCSTACGPGRFKAWSTSTIGGLNQPNTPEKCECIDGPHWPSPIESMQCRQKSDGGFIECSVLEVR